MINKNRIINGIFKETVTNEEFGTIFGGTFAGSVDNSNNGSVGGGVFNGNTGLNAVENAYSIKWNDAYSQANSEAKIEKVNGVSLDGPAVWDPYVVVIDEDALPEVTITANTEIFSLNGYPIGDGNCKSSYDGSDYKTVKFTMPGEPVELNKQITNGNGGNLVMEGGYPKISIGGKYSCSGTDWAYREGNTLDPTDTGTLTLMSGTYDFSLANPQDTTNKTPADSAVACAVETQSGVEITGGTFSTTVENSYGTISGGTFAGSVTNQGTITSGTFNGKVTNYLGRTISGGTFKGTVNNDYGTISGGTFAAGLSKNNGSKILGGIFNGNANLNGVTGVHSITWDAASPDAKIVEVNDVSAVGVSAVWDPYVVVTESTPAKTKVVTITASTEIFSLNGKPIDESNYPNKNDKTTVTFTMPDTNVVLNGAIASGDLVMKGGYPEASNGGTTPLQGQRLDLQ